MSSELLQRVAALLRPVPDFPKPDVLFWDIEPVLRDPRAMEGIIDTFDRYWVPHDIDVIAGFDARGFIFGHTLAYQADLPFVQIRKKGKLPGKTVSQSYKLEYGEAEVEMIDDGFIAGKRVLLVDDLLATGGTALAGAQLVERLGGIVAGFACVTELPDFTGRYKLKDYPVQSLISILDGKPYVGVEYCVDILSYDKKSSDLLLIERLAEPVGLALPGGRIEHEGLLAAGKREFFEETGCTFNPDYFELHSVLTKPDRDPRGPKVSYVLLGFTDTTHVQDEPGKTIVRLFSREDGLPDRSRFVLGHGDVVYSFSDTLKQFSLIE